MKVRIRCKKCKHEMEVEIQTSPLGPLKPDQLSPLSRIKLDKNSLDKLLEVAPSAGRGELESIGIHVPIDEWNSAQERKALRKFLSENIRISREEKRSAGEKYVVSTAPWVMGDSFKDVDLPSSEIKSMGVKDLRMIPGLTLQKKVYGITKGRDREIMKGIVFLVILDGSGSMFTTRKDKWNKGKIAKALLVARETYEFCQKLGFKYKLVVFSDRGVRIPEKRLREFMYVDEERGSYSVWNGGTQLERGLSEFEEKEYKDANVIIISDMDIADFESTKQKIKKLSKLSNTFKIVLIEDIFSFREEKVKKAKELFEDEVQVMVITV